ncbi:adenylyl-sulfate kinase [Pseudodesulfovibrio sp. zrk46]|uniref:adenylyl-sulfate kinase n=1 Tax=Pseudodesulfovibrio sp. zrk46 TaxID=2725288 RepID=UPI00144920D5|nr:adenylyl-sulfate kinase [Pseudodesulfovibrio sp. zrk46]QJB57599.1 adenylyl-sulfate kinase [Pseudodesulfovibrio sp. zrk46]
MVFGKNAWAIWVVGLPGSGKSSLVRGIADHLKAKGITVTILAMDRRRKTYFPEPTYSAREREEAYALLADEAASLVKQGECVIIDGSAYRKAMRDRARCQISRFAEIYIYCDLEEAVRRESLRPNGEVLAGLYHKALERKKTGQVWPGLGEVIGVDVPFEENSDAELVIDSTRLSQEETLGKALHFLDSWLSDA